MRDLDFPVFSLSCLKPHCFPWTPLHTPLRQPHCSHWISNNRTPLCLIPCRHVHSQRDIRDSENKKQWSRSSSPALNYWLLSLGHELRVHLNSWGTGGSVLLQLLLMPCELHKYISFYMDFFFLNSMLGQENISISLQWSIVYLLILNSCSWASFLYFIFARI